MFYEVSSVHDLYCDLMVMNNKFLIIKISEYKHTSILFNVIKISSIFCYMLDFKIKNLSKSAMKILFQNNINLSGIFQNVLEAGYKLFLPQITQIVAENSAKISGISGK